MASNDKKTDTGAALKSKNSANKEASTKKVEKIQSEDKIISDQSKSEDSEKHSDAPSGYSRGEGQKAVSKAYKDNWNAIYAKKRK